MKAAGILRPIELNIFLRTFDLFMRPDISTAHSAQILRSCAVVLIATLVALIAGCEPSPEAVSRGRVILIGIDGASPRIVNELFADGKLPNLSKLAREGVSGALRSEIPIHSPRIWNTIVTGMSPEQHGITTFSYPGADGKPHLYASTDRKARALWTIASAAGLRVGVVNFWNTYPLEKLDGVMVSDHVLAKEIEGRHKMAGSEEIKVGAVIYPEAWSAKLAKLIKDDATLASEAEDPFAEGKILPRWVRRDELQRRFKEDGALASIAKEILRAENPDLMMVLLPGIDRISHYLWGVMESPEHYTKRVIPTPETRAGGRAALFAYYEYTDALIGALIEGYGPDDLVMVVSDHGFEAHQGMIRLTGNHVTEKAILGVIFARGPGIEPKSSAQGTSVNDITPTILAWLGLPTAQDMKGVPASFLSEEQRRAIAPVKTYGDLPIEFLDESPLPSGVEDDIVEQLKSLGYIGE